MFRQVYCFIILTIGAFQVKAQVGTYSTINFPNNYTNTITSALYTSNFRSGFIYQSNGSINYGLTGVKSHNFRFRWLAHDNGGIDYSTDTDQLMFLDGYGNLNLKGNLTANGNIGIGAVPTSDKVTIDMGSTRGVVNMVSDGDNAAYLDLKFSVKNTASIAADKPIFWEASLRKDGYFSADLTGPTLEFYAVKKNGAGYYAPLLFKSNGDVILAGARSATNGNVGIGTTDTRGYKLAVNGDAIFTKIKVKTYGGWPDYVFSDEYHLPPLSEVAAYVKEHKHLPDMPAAEEVEKEGIDVAEMNKLLLKKMEEMMLYMFKQQEEISKLKEQNEWLLKKCQ
ncbi:hypothetical protein [Chitinophaga japonensis]|uniref:Endosialidase-like protein n=1 Tax=Chitinophaga japonensis TaxID=104662 RepID=A0A562SYT6_CHIJA|nr:hypothetical protein [Chitinophaga japonensis]TWI86228.1 hypothetical protein LX66_3480 [Chitinophaga japonensis]